MNKFNHNFNNKNSKDSDKDFLMITILGIKRYLIQEMIIQFLN